uniref:OSJNBa0036B17.2 protein n=1 Tax=Oryza sativa subsp. japonica TaxID=39947 RepID=Q7F9H8_ORYSJ|nr:OSJNBa0036B17.2 [Oryza sativa Japonica Group]
MAEERESFESQWAPSDVTEENLKEMVAHGVLPAKEIIGWRPAFGEAFPTPDTHEVVERMYKIFSNAIVVSYSHLLPVVPYNAFNPPPPTGQASGGPKIRSDTQTNTSKSASQSDSRKRKLALSDDEGDDAGNSSNKEPSDIDPFGKDSEPTDMETGPSKENGPAAEDRPSNEQPATDNVEASNEPPTGNQSAEARVGANQEPPTGNQSGTEPNKDIPEVEAQTNSPPRKDASADPGSSSPVKVQEPARPRPKIITSPMIGDEEEILWIQSAKDSRPPILVKWWDDDMQPQGIVINKQKEDEEVCLLKKALGQATHIVNRIHLRNEAKTATLERLVPHLGTLEATRNQLHEGKELARKTDHDLRDWIAELQDSNFELSGSSKVQAAKISELEKRIQALENDKAELARQRDSALKDVEDRKIKSQAQFDVLVHKIKRLGGARDEVATAGTPLVQAMFFNNNGPSTFDASEIFDKLRIAPDTYFKNIKEAGNGTSEEAALDLINDAQKAADKIAVDVVERFQDNDLRPIGSDNSDDEKTDTN